MLQESGGRSWAIAMLFPGQELGDWVTRSTAHQSLPPGIFGKGKKAVPDQTLLCLHVPSASLSAFASYFKVITPSGKLEAIEETLKVEDKVINKVGTVTT